MREPETRAWPAGSRPVEFKISLSSVRRLSVENRCVDVIVLDENGVADGAATGAVVVVEEPLITRSLPAASYTYHVPPVLVEA